MCTWSCRSALRRLFCLLLQAWVGSPAIYVFDCSAAGLIINSFRAFADQRAQVHI